MSAPGKKSGFLPWIDETLRWRVAVASGFSAVALGAFGAHGLQRILEQHHAVETWKTAVLYHLVHSLLLVVLAEKEKYGKTWLCMACGILIFSGSLYALAVTGIHGLGAVTPLGGLLLLSGWGLLFFSNVQLE